MPDLDDLLRDIRESASGGQADEPPTAHEGDDALFAAAIDVLDGGDLSPATIQFLLQGVTPRERNAKSSLAAQARVRAIAAQRPGDPSPKKWDTLRRARESSGVAPALGASALGIDRENLARLESGDLEGLLRVPPKAVAAYVRLVGAGPEELLQGLFARRSLAADKPVGQIDPRESDRAWVLTFLTSLTAPPPREVEATRMWTWTNKSVTQFAKGRDPVAAMLERAQGVAVAAIDAGWKGPPFDPFSLGAYLGIEITANEDVKDARTIPTADGLRIEFNPSRPRPRIRYSIAHEIGHTLFPDCRAYVRNRASYHELRGDEWQIESLCNIAAAEFLMPIGSLAELASEVADIDTALALRERFQVSVEAVLIRMVRSSGPPAAMFAASRVEASDVGDRYRLDYTVGSPTWRFAIPKGSLLPAKSVVAECAAVGFTAKGSEAWSEASARMQVECVGIPPYPNSRHPRVVGILREAKRSVEPKLLMYLVGDATQPRGSGPKLIAHIVNDATSNWGGGGFAQFVRRRWPAVQQEFKVWAATHPDQFQLGRVHIARIEDGLWVAHMVAQRGYGASPKPRIRYEALQSCLQQVAQLATERSASVHMPRIGTGQAGGQWPIIEDLVRDQVCERGIAVTVYDPSGSDASLRTPELPGLADT